jgi:hypothetical protein
MAAFLFSLLWPSLVERILGIQAGLATRTAHNR